MQPSFLGPLRQLSPFPGQVHPPSDHPLLLSLLLAQHPPRIFFPRPLPLCWHTPFAGFPSTSSPPLSIQREAPLLGSTMPGCPSPSPSAGVGTPLLGRTLSRQPRAASQRPMYSSVRELVSAFTGTG